MRTPESLGRILSVLGVLALLAAGCSNQKQEEVPPPPPPVVQSLTPASLTAGTGSFKLTVDGSNFRPGASVHWNGQSRTTRLLTAQQLEADITATDVARAGMFNVTVANAGAGSNSSAAIFTVNNPAPALPTLAPTSVVAGQGVTVLLSGSGFVQESVVRWNGLDRQTTYWNANQLSTTLQGTETASPGMIHVSVFNPGPGGGQSSDVVFVIADTTPVESAMIVGRPSVSSTGGDANGASFNTTIGAGGRYVAFASVATNVVGGDSNNAPDIFLSDTCQSAPANCIPQTILVSVASDGTPGDGGSFEPAVTADGRYVAFHSFSTNLVPDDTNNMADIFVRDTCVNGPGNCSPTTLRISVASDGTQGNAGSFEPVISEDGQFVAFRSYASNLVANDQNLGSDVFVHDRDSDGNNKFDEPGGTATIRVSVMSDGSEIPTETVDAAISVTGRFVAFRGDLFDTGVSEIILRDTCFGANPGCTPSTLQIGLTAQDSEDSESRPPSVSEDGRFVAFSSFADNLVPGDTNFAEDVFVRDTCIGASPSCVPQTIRVSVASNGGESTGDSLFPSISRDGRYVAFESNSTDLVPGDTNGRSDVFIRDTCLEAPSSCTPGTLRVSVAADGVQGNDHSFDGVLSSDGEFVAFSSTATTLVPGDANSSQDVFLARSGFLAGGGSTTLQELRSQPAKH